MPAPMTVLITSAVTSHLRRSRTSIRAGSYADRMGCTVPHARRLTIYIGLLATALAGFVEVVEQPASRGAGERVEAMRLPLLDGVARDVAFRAKELGFALHLVVPHVLVVLA